MRPTLGAKLYLRRLTLLLGTATGFLVMANTQQPPTAMEWLQRMQQSFQVSNYSLSLIRVSQQHFEPIAIEHGRVNGEELSYVNYLNGPERAVLHTKEVVTYFQHDEAAYSVSGLRALGPIPRAFINNISGLKESYRFTVGGRNRVMGRAAQLIRIEPKQADRYSHWLWLDAEHGMLLRADVVEPGGKPLEHVQIVSMQYFDQPQPVIERLAQLELPAAVPLLEAENSAHTIRTIWLPGYLPQGFQLVGRDRHRLEGVDVLVDYQLYSDGLSSVSIYIGAATRGGVEKALVSQGATHLVALVKDNLEIAVIGSLPNTILQRIAESVYAQRAQP